MLNNYRFHAGQFFVNFVQFRIEGSDALSFLQAQSTYDVKSLERGHFHLITFLDTQGKIESYGWLLSASDHYLYLVPPALEEQTQARLTRFLVAEDVEVTSSPANWTIVVGEKAPSFSPGFVGEMFSDKAILCQEKLSLAEIPRNERELWRKLTGSPSFEGDDFQPELINNTLLFDLALSQRKGCYPGQETVSKIATHRGAAYAPVLLETDSAVSLGPLFLEGRKIGEILEVLEWENKILLRARLLRDFRVEGMKLRSQAGENVFQSKVRYYPLLKSDPHSKAEELFHLGAEKFKYDELKEAEDYFRLALEIDPGHADACESLGVLLGRLERFPEAIEVMKRLTEVDPNSVMAHTNLSLYLMKVGRIEEAEQEKSLATVKSFQKFGAEAASKRAAEEELQKKQSEWAQREGMFLQVLEIDPDDTLANYGVGSIAVEKGDWEKARLHLEKVLAADPKYSVAYLALGKTYKALKLTDEARATFNTGIRVAAAKGDLMPANQMQMELDGL